MLDGGRIGCGRDHNRRNQAMSPPPHRDKITIGLKSGEAAGSRTGGGYFANYLDPTRISTLNTGSQSQGNS